MSLTGWGLPTTLAALAVVVFVCILTDRPRFRHRWAQVLTRGVRGLVFSLVLMLLAGVYLNNQNGFYANWGDLVGQGAIPTTKTQSGVSATFAAAQQAPGPGLGVHKGEAAVGKPKTHQERTVHYVVNGQHSGFHNDVYVRLPQGYDPQHPGGYPVIVALHGFPAQPRVFHTLGNFFKDADDVMASHQMASAIIVMPQIDYPTPLDTECVDAPHGAKAETWLADDLPQWVAAHFNVSSKRDAWATWGYSYGGWCALMLSVRHPAVYGAAVAFQGYNEPKFSPSYIPFKPGSPQYEVYDLVRLIKKKSPPVALWMFSSVEDKFSYDSSQALARAASSPMSVTNVVAARGGHRIDVWVPKIADSFQWLGANLPGFKSSVPVKR